MDECGPCKYRNENTRALKYCITCQEPQCKTCSEIHKSSKATRNHLLVNTNELNKDSKTTKDLESLQRCNDHPEKQAEYYCIDHKHFLCSTCLLNIQKLDCKAIVDIETAGEQLIKSKFNETVKTDLEKTISHCKNEVEKIGKCKEASKNERKKLNQFIETHRKQILSAFDKCKNEIVNEIDLHVKAQTASLNAAESSLTKSLKSAEENKSILQTVCCNGSKADVFRCALSLLQQEKNVQKDETTLTTKLFTHSVQTSPAMDTLLRSIESNSALQFTTNVTLETFTHSDNRRTDIESFLETAKEVTLSGDRDLSNDYTCSSADAESEESSTKAAN